MGPTLGVEEALPYISNTGMCHLKDMVFKQFSLGQVNRSQGVLV